MVRTQRYLSVDILRGVAIVLMIQVHFVDNLARSDVDGWDGWLYWASVWLGALPAPLFAFVTGVSYALWWRTQQAHQVPEQRITQITLRRGAFLFVLGLVFNVVVWLPEEVFNWDILTTLGTALLLFAFARGLPGPVLLLLGALIVLLSPLLRIISDYPAYWNDDTYEYDFTFRDVLYGYLANGYFPLFPWLVFPLVGFVSAAWLYDDGKHVPRRRYLLASGLLLLAYPMAMAGVRSERPWLLARYYANGLTEFPASMEFVLGSLGFAMLSLLALRAWLDRRDGPTPQPAALAFLRVYSTYSLTVYVLHHLVILWPLWLVGALTNDGDSTLYWRDAMPPFIAFNLSIVFLCGCFEFLRALERRGWYPLESLMRRCGS